MLKATFGAFAAAAFSMFAAHIMDEFTFERSRKAYWDERARDVVEDLAFVLELGVPEEGMSDEEQALARARIREAQAGFVVLQHGPLNEMPGLKKELEEFLDRVEDRVVGIDVSDEYPALREELQQLHGAMVECLVVPERSLAGFTLERLGLGWAGPEGAPPTCHETNEEQR